MKEVTIKIKDDAASDFADIICWMRGYIDAKGEDWECSWLTSSLNTISDINAQLKNIK